MFSVGSGGFARVSGAVPAFPLFAATGQKHAKTHANAALGPLGAQNGLLRPARVPPVRSKGLFEPASAPLVRSRWPLWPAPEPPVRSERACLGAASAIKMAGLACSGFGQCAQRGCPSLLWCRQCAQRGFSSVLFEIAVRKSWSRLHCALSHCTLHCFAPCMDMHGSTLVYIYIEREI